jgi:hypothetical protein
MPSIDEIITLVQYFNVELSDKQVKIYAEALDDIDPEVLHLATIELVKSSKWMPKVSEIRDMVKNIQTQAETQGVYDWHTARNSGEWHQVGSWDYQGGWKRPAIIEWKHCDECGANYSNWDYCPDCEGQL